MGCWGYGLWLVRCLIRFCSISLHRVPLRVPLRLQSCVPGSGMVSDGLRSGNQTWLAGKSPKNGPFSIAVFDFRRVDIMFELALSQSCCSGHHASFLYLFDSFCPIAWVRDFKRNLTGKVSRILLWRVLKYSQPTIKSRSFAQTRVSRSSKRANREFPKRRHVRQDRFRGLSTLGACLKGFWRVETSLKLVFTKS